ncbi:hypothetical protein LFE_0302 [Leptospirillum ferrooxidans C2-3]|uniref:Uncharacterized protein n=1 Tax=Leptospirillum ferrooxidans (strain C2-3) TaxID=1162668 RepID=I0IL75_LEPFC|nr:hypothetical protein LFE_0302 [Leptospirillum ferrooxidans C2-3]
MVRSRAFCQKRVIDASLENGRSPGMEWQKDPFMPLFRVFLLLEAEIGKIPLCPHF